MQYWVPWVAADGNGLRRRAGRLCGEPPEATDVGGSALPSNETFGVTAIDGTGSAEFDVFTPTENTTLGCSQTVACSLVAVPIMGISCDADLLGTSPTAAELADLADCEDTGYYQPGRPSRAQRRQSSYDLTVSGSLWWSPSNWRNRITVPADLRPAANACSLVSSSNVVDVYGSELMLQATEPVGAELLPERHGQVLVRPRARGEPEARDDGGDRRPPRRPSPATPSRGGTANRWSTRRWP